MVPMFRCALARTYSCFAIGLDASHLAEEGRTAERGRVPLRSAWAAPEPRGVTPSPVGSAGAGGGSAIEPARAGGGEHGADGTGGPVGRQPVFRPVRMRRGCLVGHRRGDSGAMV